jgi:hypothetical protein
MRDEISKEFGCAAPEVLVEFWATIGAGYFGKNRDLYFFGDENVSLPREGLLTWNKRPFFNEIGPPPSRGGPLFFAETCFGVQIGIQRIEGQLAVMFFDVDCYESYILAPDMDSLFSEALADPTAITDPARLQGVTAHLGKLPNGKHYAPIISPLVGGSDDPQNFSVQDPVVHFTTAIAVRKSVT